MDGWVDLFAAALRGARFPALLTEDDVSFRHGKAAVSCGGLACSWSIGQRHL